MNIPFKQHPHVPAAFKAIMDCKSGNFYLSILAGSPFYSTPRADLEDPKEYTAVELGIFDSKQKTWASYNQLSKAFEIIGNTGEYSDDMDYIESLDNPQSSVFAAVPIDIIFKLVESI